MKVSDFIGEKAQYDEHGQMIFGVKEERLQLIADTRGWGAIQNLFKRNDNTIDYEKATLFQDHLGKFIADAITEKLQREKSENAN